MNMLAKPDPYLIPGPAKISFSGGRTSAYMLHEIVRAHGGKLPPDVHVCFSNTGKEREETLRFVYECGTRWNVNVRWLEYRNDERGYEEVGYSSASRNGEPFAALIAKKKMAPNWGMRFCTENLKIKPMMRFMADHGFESYQEAIGLRYDEGMRVFKMLARNDEQKRNCIAPLSKAKVTKADIMEFWARQPFDLGIKPGEGNCDLCFMKGRGLRKELIRTNPRLADWWIEQEDSVNGFFDKRDSYAGLVQEVARQPDLFEYDLDVEHDAECGFICGTE